MKRRRGLRKFISRRPDSKKKSGSPHSPKSGAGWCTRPRSARGLKPPTGTLQKPRGLDFQVAHVTCHSKHVCIQAGPVGPPRSHSSLRGSAPQNGPCYVGWHTEAPAGSPPATLTDNNRSLPSLPLLSLPWLWLLEKPRSI